MPTPQELEAELWRKLKSDMTVMLGTRDQFPRPMTAQIEDDAERGPIWFFTARDTDLARSLSGAAPSLFTFCSKGHDLHATVVGTLRIDDDRAVIERLWNRYVEAWFEGGIDDPNLVLLRFDPKSAEIWEDASSVLAGIKLLLGADPKKDYKDKVAKVSL